MSLRLSSNGRHTRERRAHAPALPFPGWDNAAAGSVRPGDTRRCTPDSAGDGAPQEPPTAAEAGALLVVLLSSGGFIVTNDPVLGFVSAALSWVLFALCCFQGFRRKGGRQSRVGSKTHPAATAERPASWCWIRGNVRRGFRRTITGAFR